MKKIFAAALAAFLMAVTPAFADTTVNLTPLWNTVVELITPVISMIVVALIGWFAALLKRKIGIDIEAKHREALHSAAMTGVNLALTKVGGLKHLNIDARYQVWADATNWVVSSVPDALKYFGIDSDTIKSIVASKLSALENAQPAASDIPADLLKTVIAEVANLKRSVPGAG